MEQDKPRGARPDRALNRGVRRILPKRPILAASVASLLLLQPASASPWGREPGEIFLSARTDHFSASGPATDPSALRPVRFERFETNNYAEAGIGFGVTLGGKAVYGTSTFDDGISVFSANGFSEIEGFGQLQLHRSARHVVSARLAGAAPTRFQTGARPGLINDGADIEARLLYGRTLTRSPVKLFVAAEAGYRRRFGSGADQVRGDFLLGVEPTKRLLGLAELFTVKSLGRASPGGADYDLLKAQPSLAWRFTRRWSLQAGATFEVAGRNLLLGDTYFVGLWTEF